MGPTRPTADGRRLRSAASSTAALLHRCRAGDQRAWEALILRYERLVFSIPLNLGLDREEAGDIMQSTFTELLDSLDRIREGEHLGAWLATVARRLAWRARGRSRQDQHHLSVALHDPTESETGIEVAFTDAVARHDWILEGVLALDDPCRELLTLLYLDPRQPTYDEVAELLGRPRGSIGPQRGRCLARLRTILQQLDSHA